MSIFETALHTIKNDLAKSAAGWADRVINSSLPHDEYIATQTKYRALTDVVVHINNALDFIKNNPDSDIPDSFLQGAPGKPDPEVEPVDPSASATTVDIAS